MNPSAVEEVNFSLCLFSGGQSYTYEGGRLRPGEVLWVNIKELRDRRIPDQMGRLLPRGVSAGAGEAGRAWDRRNRGEPTDHWGGDPGG